MKAMSIYNERKDEGGRMRDEIVYSSSLIPHPLFSPCLMLQPLK